MWYWIDTYGLVDGLRIMFARSVGPLFWPAWYVAPLRNRQKWCRIACFDIDNCSARRCPMRNLPVTTAVRRSVRH